MNRDASPTLTDGNKLYLYDLLKRAIGCGKQTFLPKVEDALAEAGLTGEDIGFATTRALMEALEGIVALTVFKGGRVYATLVAQPTWDAMLEEPEAEAAPKDNKPWKRKKGAKLKPVRPKQVKRAPEAEPEPASEPDLKPGEADVEPVNMTDEGGVPDETETKLADDLDHEVNKAEKESAPTESDTKPASEPNIESGVAETKPHIALTVTYDPYTGNDTETVLKPETTGTTAKPAGALNPESSRIAPASGSDSDSARVSRSARRDYPRDFAADVHVPGALLSELSRIMPFRTDVLAELTEDFRIARNLDSVQGTRARASFPLRYSADGATPLTVVIKRNPNNGAPWVLAEIDGAGEDVLADTGLDGLPMLEGSIAEQALRRLAAKVRLDANVLEGLASRAFPAVWSAATLRQHIALAWKDAGAGQGELSTGLFDREGVPIVIHLEPSDGGPFPLTLKAI